jgi:hypothetical protein
VSAQWHSTSVRPVAQYECPPSGTVPVSAQWHSTSVRPVAQYQCPPSGTVPVSAQWHSTSVRPVAQYECPPSGTVRVSAQWHSTSVRFNVKTKKKNGPNLGRRENYWVIQTTFTRRIFIFFCPKLYLATKN